MKLNMYYDPKKNKAFAKKMLAGTTDYYVGLSKICPNCGKAIIGHSAISRKDNKTEICDTCGTLEAVEVFEKYQREVKNESRNNNRNKRSKHRNKTNT